MEQTEILLWNMQNKTQVGVIKKKKKIPVTLK